MIKDVVKPIWQAYSGERAKEDVGGVIQHHRIQASPGYREAAKYVLKELEKAGLSARIETYPATYENKFWTAGSFQEWECSEATLHLVEPADDAQKLADYEELKLSVIQRSAPFSGQAEVVVLEDGLTEAEYEGLELAGKIVLTKGSVARVHQLAVEQHGAIGILFDGLSPAPPVREAMDLPDVRQYTSFWWSGQPDEQKCFGFVLTPRLGSWLRDLVRRTKAEGKPVVQVRAEVNTRFYDGEIEIVSATIPGNTPETVILVSHLCHPQPSANDNASGVAANLEAARTLQRLISTGELPQPRRNIRFLWMPEMTGSYAYLARHEDDIPNLVAGLNLDMVGEDQTQTGSVALIERPPEAMASFTPDLLERLREEIFDDVKSYSGFGNYSLYRYATTEFSGGSDHYVFSDPTVGVPMPMLIQWPDKFYHTSADTLDKVNAESLRRNGTLAAAYAYFIARAGDTEVTWLSHEMLVRFNRRLGRLAQEAVTEMLENHESTASREARLAQLERQVAFRLDRHRVALQGLIHLGGGGGSLADMLYYEASRFVNRELERVRRVVLRGASEPAAEEGAEKARERDEWDTRAAQLIPHRLYRGPVRLSGELRALPLEEQSAWFELQKSRQIGGWTLPVLAEYWADGRRGAAEIVDLIEMETGIRDPELIVRWFELLAKVGLMELN